MNAPKRDMARWWWVLSSVIIPSCSAPNTAIGVPDDTVGTKRTLGESESFANIGVLQATDRYLLAADLRIAPHLVIFDRSTGSQVTRLGQHGEGPNEFMSPYWSFEQDGDVWWYDVANVRLIKLDLGLLELTEEHRLHVDARLGYPLRWGDTIIGGGRFFAGPLAVFHRDSFNMREIEVQQPFGVEQVASSAPRRTMNRTFVVVNPSQTRIAAVYYNWNRVSFFTMDGTPYAVGRGPRDTEPSFRLIRDGQSLRYDDAHERAYISVTATDSLVYALFDGSARGEDRLPRLVHIFDWNGVFRQEVVLDREVYRIAVSKDGRTLYGAVWEPVPLIAEFVIIE